MVLGEGGGRGGGEKKEVLPQMINYNTKGNRRENTEANFLFKRHNNVCLEKMEILIYIHDECVNECGMVVSWKEGMGEERGERKSKRERQTERYTER